ncbi:ash family protein [Rahnella variigena]|uniref:ash family protein n=1 Tax=Rahnella variigena TaxID=574964 RepID=UPI004044DF31
MDIFMRKNSFINNKGRACDKPILKKKRLLTENISSYSFPAVAKSTAGRRNPSHLLATRHAPSVFFYVVAFAHLSLAQWFLSLCAYRVMVAQAGQPSGWPVSNKAGIPTPVWATTSKCRNLGGSNNQYLLEVAVWLLPLSLFARNSPIYSWPFAAQTFAPYLAASKSQHLLKSMPGVLWPKTLCWPLLAACLAQRRRCVMSNKPQNVFPYAFSNEGHDKILRAHQASACLAELLALAASNTQSSISLQGMAALFESLADQLDGAIGCSEMFQGEVKMGENDVE